MKKIDDLISFTKDEFNAVLKTNKVIREFHNGTNLTSLNYSRHIIEAINRIHLNNEVDAFALVKATSLRKNNVSKKLASYLAEEISHDEIIIKDMENFGLTKTQVWEKELFFSTKLLIGYLKFSVEKEGYLPSVLWNWFVEWYSDNFNEKIVNSASKLFGDKNTRGMKEHLQIDKTLNHAVFLNEIVEEAYIENKEKVESHICSYIKLVEMYFDELLKKEMKTEPNK